MWANRRPWTHGGGAAAPAVSLPPVIVGFVGAGNMAAAIARGWSAAPEGPGRPERMLFNDLDEARAAALAQQVGGEARTSMAELRDESELLVLAVKPAALDDVAGELEGRAPAVLSMLAATSLEAIGRAFPAVPALRVMPNQPVEVAAGVVCHAPAVGMADELRTRVLGLLEALGDVVELEESQIEAAMAVMSCSPAYVAVFAQALAAAGEREGLAPELAASLVAQTVRGTGELLQRRSAAAVQRSVAPPGGATEAGLEALERDGFTAALDDAVEASLERFR